MVIATVNAIQKFPDTLTTGFVAELFAINGQNLPANVTGYSNWTTIVLYIALGIVIKLKKCCRFHLSYEFTSLTSKLQSQIKIKQILALNIAKINANFV